MSLVLPPEVNTPQLLEAVRFEVEELRNWASDSEIKRKVGAATAPEPSRSTETQIVLDQWLAGKALSLEALTAVSQELKEIKPVTVHLTLAALPGESLKTTLVNWFRTNCHQDLLVNFSADRTIGGGIIIRTPNHIFDYSFRQRLIDGRRRLPELIRNAG